MVRVGLHHQRAAALRGARPLCGHGAGDLRLRVRLSARRPQLDLSRGAHSVDHHDGIRRGVVLIRPEGSFSGLSLGAAVIGTALSDLWYGFSVAFSYTWSEITIPLYGNLAIPVFYNLTWCFVGVLIGNLVGVLPGMGVLATISILLPLTFGMHKVAAILMLAGVYYGAQYGGAICSILLNLPCHPPHAVTCLDGYPLTKQGKGGTALGVTVISSFVGASWGITEMIFLAPILVQIALKFGPA